MATKIVYLPDDMVSIWEEVMQAAKKERRGIGFYICQKWEESKKTGKEIF